MTYSAFGDVIQNRFRVDETPMLISSIHADQPITFSRLRSSKPGHGPTRPTFDEDAYAIHLALNPLPSFQLYLDGKELPPEPSPAGGIYVFNLQNAPTASFYSPFDFVRCYVPHGALREAALEAGRPDAHQLRPNYQSMRDPVLENLGRCLVPAFESPEATNSLFLDHIALALRAHLIDRFAQSRDAANSRGGLAPWQLRRVQEIINVSLSSETTMVTLAAECGLSASHFGRAFRQSMGLPPHKWLMQRRVDKARQLLLGGDLSLMDISKVCGFADQSHMNRVFGHIVGESPGAWRKANRSAVRRLEPA